MSFFPTSSKYLSDWGIAMFFSNADLPLQKSKLAHQTLLYQAADQAGLCHFQLFRLQIPEYLVHCICLREFRTEAPKEVLPENTFSPIVIVGISRSLFKDKHEQSSGQYCDPLRESGRLSKRSKSSGKFVSIVRLMGLRMIFPFWAAVVFRGCSLYEKSWDFKNTL